MQLRLRTGSSVEVHVHERGAVAAAGAGGGDGERRERGKWGIDDATSAEDAGAVDWAREGGTGEKAAVWEVREEGERNGEAGGGTQQDERIAGIDCEEPGGDAGRNRGKGSG